MKPGSMREWLRPILGSALLLVGAAGLTYKVISGYRHAAPDAFVSVEDQNKLRAASASDHPVEAPTIPVDITTPPQRTASAARTVPVTAAPLVAPADHLGSASSAATDLDLSAEAQDKLACTAIKTERHEIERALNKQYSPEEGHYMQRRLHELAAQSLKRKCAE